MKLVIYHLLVYWVFYGYPAQSELIPRDLLEQSLLFFDKGHYQQALDTLASIDAQKDFDSSDDMLMVFRIRAISYAEIGDKEHAKEAIRELLFLNPQYKFDPFDTPVSVVELAAIELSEIEQKNQSLASIKNQSITEPLLIASTPVIVPQAAPFITTLFPLGINHFYQGSNTKGRIYLSLQASSLVVNIASYWWKQSYLKEYGASKLANTSQKSAFDTAQTVQYLALGALVLSLSASIIDAMISYFQSSAQNHLHEETTSIKNS